jgi:hypothetical protein
MESTPVDSRRAPLVALICASFCACATSQAPDDAAVCTVYSAQRSGIEVVAQGRVTRILGVQPGRTSPHEGFLFRLDSGCALVVRVEVTMKTDTSMPAARCITKAP